MRRRKEISKYIWLLNLVITSALYSNAFGQERHAINKAWINTFQGDHLNTWLLINIKSEADSIVITEGRLVDTLYAEIEEQGKYFQTNNKQLIMVDDFEKLVYIINLGKKSKIPHGLNFHEVNTDSVVFNDSFYASKCLTRINMKDEFWEVQTDTINNVIDWVMITSSSSSEDNEEFTIDPNQLQIIKYFLVSQNRSKVSIERIIKPSDYGLLSRKGNSPGRKCGGYEFIDLSSN